MFALISLDLACLNITILIAIKKGIFVIGLGIKATSIRTFGIIVETFHATSLHTYMN
jgi:hypothetical protein